jgi:broad specificity polyphosphatase/5'/3'-nucleotidase SurE
MKPLILVTNDDGIGAPGIKALIDTARQFGDVLVVASRQSAIRTGTCYNFGTSAKAVQSRTFRGYRSL